jgi:DNA-binding NarL/FixJ family response regulator
MVAVEPLALFRVMKLILDASEIQILARPQDVSRLLRQARRLQPDLLITNARLLGEQACEVLASLKRSSPRSKIILTDFDARLASIATRCGADVYLEEDLLVGRLLATVRRLTTARRSRSGVKASLRAARVPRRRRAG